MTFLEEEDLIEEGRIAHSPHERLQDLNVHSVGRGRLRQPEKLVHFGPEGLGVEVRKHVFHLLGAQEGTFPW
eukprot:CAMPEP_0170565302 /NCGR_PEP_ID=MMETSP0211-20121228/78024_1 /TAXON_ID=311385 /ORGANISM="Pseudokeronopsis sp., Strain OXSARD2" /LENGTH=71 /DNA_ID=CAMNT_0010885927 /DNA_START=32 /DNA_END=244 /DNA_ORIENTATION=+